MIGSSARIELFDERSYMTHSSMNHNGGIGVLSGWQVFGQSCKYGSNHEFGTGGG